MSLNVGNQKFNNGRRINYLNKDFADFRQNLIEFSKTYFPQVYSDFNETSPGMIFIEMASYVGDVLSYYIDDTLKESLLLYATDRANIIALANYLGYKPKTTSPAVTTLSVYQIVPAIGTGKNAQPDSNYFLRINEGMTVSAVGGITFTTTEPIDFNIDSDREISVYTTDSFGDPEEYVVKKYVNAISSEIREITFDFGTTPTEFSKVNLADTNVIDILDIRDDNGNKWYKVPYLAQEMVFVDYPNSEKTDKDLAQFKDSVPNILKVIKTNRRFTTQINDDNTTSIVFGGGNSVEPDETLIPSLKNVGLGLKASIDKLDVSFDPENFLKTKTYGAAPIGEFTIRYLVGGGIESNVGVGQITTISSVSFNEDLNSFNSAENVIYQRVRSSLAVENEIKASGGKGPESNEEIRQNALANFASQNRAVTRKDYQIRALSLPNRYGSLAKVYCSADGELDTNNPSSILAETNTLNEFTDLITTLNSSGLTQEEIKEEVRTFLLGKEKEISAKGNEFSVNLYTLGYDSNKNLITINRALKENLKTYIKEYKMLSDTVNILDGYIINIGVEFEIRVYAGYNQQEVISKCVEELQEYFNIDNWTFNMTINISEIEVLLASIEGVESVPTLKIVNKCNGGYSANSYNIDEATKGKLIYPSLDPSVFEVKFPNKDIKGRVI